MSKDSNFTVLARKDRMALVKTSIITVLGLGLSALMFILIFAENDFGAPGWVLWTGAIFFSICAVVLIAYCLSGYRAPRVLVRLHGENVVFYSVYHLRSLPLSEILTINADVRRGVLIIGEKSTPRAHPIMNVKNIVEVVRVMQTLVYGADFEDLA